MRKASAVRTRQTWTEKRRRWGSSSRDGAHLADDVNPTSTFNFPIATHHTTSDMAPHTSPRVRGSRCHMRDDLAEAAVDTVAAARFAGLPNAMPRAAYFSGLLQWNSASAIISQRSNQHAGASLQCAVPTGTALASSVQLLQAPAHPHALSAMPPLAQFHAIAGPGLASSIGAIPCNLARLRSREAAGGAGGHHGDGHWMPHSEGCCAACALRRVRGAREERPLWILFSPCCFEFRILRVFFSARWAPS
jgi:hypothetical protein